MNNISRRRLAEYGANQLIAGQPARKIARQLAAVLVQNNKSKDAEQLAADISWELERRGILADAQITTATKLGDSLRKELIKFIKQATATNQVNLNEQVDGSVIGGVRIETAAHAWDKTIAKQLTDIRETV